MRRLEHLRHLLPYAGQAVHVEEAAPVDLVRCCPPPRQAIALALQQPVQAVAAQLGFGRVRFEHGGDRARMLRLTEDRTGGAGFGANGCAAALSDFGEQAGRLLQRTALGQQYGGVVARLDRKAVLAVHRR